MDLTLSLDEQAFRDELRSWLEENPAGPTPEDEHERFAWRLEWLRRLNSGRFAAVHWPSQYGGRDGTATQNSILFAELARVGAPVPANHIAVFMAGPTIMRWGTDEQKARFLPRMLDGSEVWCQGFSEPGAGSDLASLSTFAERDGDDWIVTGQKVWTSEAQYADFCILVARTDRDVAKHKGLSYFLLDMNSPGVMVRPLRQLTGESEFNELFLDQVRIPGNRLLGGEGNGWQVALTTLTFERSQIGMAYAIRVRTLLAALMEHLSATGRIDDPLVADRVADIEIRTRFLELTSQRLLAEGEAKGGMGPEGSLTKWMWSDTNARLTELAVDVVGPDALVHGTAWSYALLRSRANSIEGGTTDVLKNIIADRVLGLPRVR